MTDDAPAVDLTEEPVLPDPMPADEFIVHEREHLLDERRRYVRTPDIQRNGRHVWERIAVTLKQQRGYPGKVFLFERLEYRSWEPREPGGDPIVRLDPGFVQYRVGYFVVSPIRNKWWWGQSAPLIPAEDWNELIQLAREEGTLLEASE